MSRGDILDVLAGEAHWCVQQGDCLEVLGYLEDDCIDAVVTDPPAGIEFMGKEWDRFKAKEPVSSGQQTEAWDVHAGTPFARQPTPRPRGKTGADLQPFQDFITAAFTEVYRVLKPGGHALVWALPRTSHHTMMGLERAGFDIRDVVVHLQGQGFPKSLDVGKAIDRAAGAEREVVGIKRNYANADGTLHVGKAVYIGIAGNPGGNFKPTPNMAFLTTPATDAARQWDGWGTALKPAAEYWVLARKPLEGTVAQNVLKWGTGALNIGAARVGNAQVLINTFDDGMKPFGEGAGHPYTSKTVAGRWPANVALSHSEWCTEVGRTEIKGSRIDKPAVPTPNAPYGSDGLHGEHPARGIGDEDGKETVSVWACPPFCAVRMLDQQSGDKRGASGRASGPTLGLMGTQGVYGPAKGENMGEPRFYGDTGAASRFFFVAKASRGEREAGLAEAGIEPARSQYRPNDPGEASDRVDRLHGSVPRLNDHPTCKSLSLMRWLVRLITPPNGLILDPFAGSGTTGAAARLEGFRCIMVEQDQRYTEIATARTAYWENRG